MTVLELVDRERARQRRMHIVAGLALAVGATCLVLALGASALGSARWMSLPRPVPFLVWLLVFAADVAIVSWTARRLARRTTRQNVAATIEREQSLRAGQLRGALEVGESGALGRRAAARLTETAHAGWTAAGAGRAASVAAWRSYKPQSVRRSRSARCCSWCRRSTMVCSRFCVRSTHGMARSCRDSRSVICRRRCCAERRCVCRSPRRGAGV